MRKLICCASIGFFSACAAVHGETSHSMHMPDTSSIKNEDVSSRFVKCSCTILEYKSGYMYSDRESVTERSDASWESYPWMKILLTDPVGFNGREIEIIFKSGEYSNPPSTKDSHIGKPCSVDLPLDFLKGTQAALTDSSLENFMILKEHSYAYQEEKIIPIEGFTSDLRKVSGEIVVVFTSDTAESNRKLISELKNNVKSAIRIIWFDKLFTASGVFDKESANAELGRVFQKSNFGKRIVKIEFKELRLPPGVIESIKQREETKKRAEAERKAFIQANRRSDEVTKLDKKCFLAVSQKEKDKVVQNGKNNISKYNSQIVLLESQKNQEQVKVKIHVLKSVLKKLEKRLTRLSSLRKKSVKTQIERDFTYANCMKNGMEKIP
ncbi:MAG: hypothetical protein GY854_07660 [Deltaproteobacteria bacterium]|nr:hypothetical protein [Deltaproteobacteria bacterium]